MEELKPCPFCGKKYSLKVYDESDKDCKNFLVVCRVVEDSPYPEDSYEVGCGAHGGYGRTWKEAIDNWNQRA